MSEIDRSINVKSAHLQTSISCVKCLSLINSLNGGKTRFCLFGLTCHYHMKTKNKCYCAFNAASNYEIVLHGEANNNLLVNIVWDSKFPHY